jgi:nucleoside-diphosphate-sugar epimerase
MRALVTGAAGFIGSRLCARLVADGDDVAAFDDLSDGRMSNLAGAPEVEFIEGDLRNEAAVRAAAKGCDIIFHQGAKRSVPRSIIEPVLTTEVNVGGTLNVLLAARDAKARVVAASSSSVYGDQDRFPQEESMSLRPKSP